MGNGGKPLPDEAHVGKVEIVGLILDVVEGDATEGAIDAERDGVEGGGGAANELSEDGLEGGDKVPGLRRTGLEVARHGTDQVQPPHLVRRRV